MCHLALITLSFRTSLTLSSLLLDLSPSTLTALNFSCTLGVAISSSLLFCQVSGLTINLELPLLQLQISLPSPSFPSFLHLPVEQRHGQCLSTTTSGFIHNLGISILCELFPCVFLQNFQVSNDTISSHFLQQARIFLKLQSHHHSHLPLPHVYCLTPVLKVTCLFKYFNQNKKPYFQRSDKAELMDNNRYSSYCNHVNFSCILFIPLSFNNEIINKD